MCARECNNKIQLLYWLSVTEGTIRFQTTLRYLSFFMVININV